MALERPNLILFMPETLRADAVLGDPAGRARTPAMDRLASEGASFTNAFCQNPICSPSRCSMFTGLYPHTRGHRSLLHLLHDYERNLFKDLREAGYRTVAFGKNDLVAQDALASSFDLVDPLVRPEKPSFMPNPWPEAHRFRRSFCHGRRESHGGEKAEYRDKDWAWIESALRILEDPPSQPFCLFLPLVFAHPPYEVEEPFFSMHDRSAVREPIRLETRLKRSYVRIRNEARGGNLLDAQDFREIRATYFGMVSRVDHQLARILSVLERKGLYDRTAVFVFTDHGDYAGDYGQVEKFVAGFEDSLVRVPLIARVPGLPAGTVRSDLVEMIDLYPTLMELAGVEPRHYHFGRSLVPLWRGQGGPHRNAVFCEGGVLAGEKHHFPFIPPQSPYAATMALNRQHPEIAAKTVMARTERHKYIYSLQEVEELYDLERDPEELDNVVGAASYAPVREEMRRLTLRWLVETTDVLPFEHDPRGWHPAGEGRAK